MEWTMKAMESLLDFKDILVVLMTLWLIALSTLQVSVVCFTKLIQVSCYVALF